MLISPTFPLGRIVATSSVLASLTYEDIATGLKRHAARDWGEVCEEDRKTNDEAVEQGLRLLSAYKAESGQKYWIITEWDRSITTILLPEDY